MLRARKWIVVVSLVAAVTALAPPAVADSAEDLSPPFSWTGNDLWCGSKANFVGSPTAPAPRPPIAPAAVPVKCTTSHKAERPGLLSGALSVRGTGTVTDGSSSAVMSYGYARHSIKKSVDRVRYEVTFSVEDAVAEVPVQHRLTTSGYVLLHVYASHTSCRACVDNSYLIVADSDPRSPAPERALKGSHTLQINMLDPSGKKLPSGTVGLVISVFPMVMTGTYATPMDVLGSSSGRARVTRVAATTA